MKHPLNALFAAFTIASTFSVVISPRQSTIRLSFSGEFHFPQKKAAEIAVKTVTGFLNEDERIERVIFNVFKQEDHEIYRKLLG